VKTSKCPGCVECCLSCLGCVGECACPPRPKRGDVRRARRAAIVSGACAMSNVMRGIDQALTVQAYLSMDFGTNLTDKTRKFRLDVKEMKRAVEALRRPDSTLTSEEWSARVRTGVAKLSPERRGLVVTCQSETDD